jgi:hypothetical protein
VDLGLYTRPGVLENMSLAAKSTTLLRKLNWQMTIRLWCIVEDSECTVCVCVCGGGGCYILVKKFCMYG